MQNQNSRLVIILCIFLVILASCNLPTEQDPGSSKPPVEPPPEEPTTHVDEPPTPFSPQEPSDPVTEEPPVGGGGLSDEPGVQNPLPPAVNLEKSSIDLQKLGTDIVGGGGTSCSAGLAIKTEQKIFLWYGGTGDWWMLCFTNFPAGTAHVKLSTQSGKFDTSVNSEPVSDTVAEYVLGLVLPASVRRDGPLEVELRVGDVSFSQTIDIQTMDLVGIYKNDVNILGAGNYYPNFNFGEQIELLGVGLLPSTTVYVGIYGRRIYFNDWDFHLLVDQFEVTTNEAGGFLGAFEITEKYRQGDYVIYYGYQPDLFENRQVDHQYDGFTVGGVSPTWQPCPADYPSTLRVGDVGFVRDDPFSPNNVRNSPSRAGDLIGQIQPGEHFIIRDGPVCDSGWIWWYVQKDDALTGWTSEGDLNNYWLVKSPEQ